MVRASVIVFLVVCVFSVSGMPGKRARRGFNNGGYGSERGGGSGYNRESDEQDASVSREDCRECGGQYFNNKNRESYGRDDYNSNEGRHGNRSH